MSHSPDHLDLFRSALIELMAAGYTDYTYSLLCEPCQVWYFEFAASISKSTSFRTLFFCSVARCQHPPVGQLLILVD